MARPPRDWTSGLARASRTHNPAARLAPVGPFATPTSLARWHEGVAPFIHARHDAPRSLFAPVLSAVCRAEEVAASRRTRERRRPLLSPAEVEIERAAPARHEDPVRRVRGRGGHGGVLRGRGGAVRALRRRDPRRQQAGRQAPAPPARRLRRRRAPALRRVPGEAGLRLLRRGPGAPLPRLRRAHPRPGDALRQPPAVPRNRHPRRLQLRLRRRRRRRRHPPAAQGELQTRQRQGSGHQGDGTGSGTGPRRAGGADVIAVLAAVGMGRRGPPAALGLRIQRQEGLASRVQGAGVVRGHRPVPRPRAGQDGGGGPRALRLAAAGD